MASDHSRFAGQTDPGASVSHIRKWPVRRLTTAWKLLEYSSAYLAVLGALEVVMVQLLLSLPPSTAPVVVGLVTFGIYANDRLVDLGSDEVSNPGRTAFARQYQSVLYVVAAVAYGTAVALAVRGGPFALGLTLVPGLAWVLYAIDWIPAVAPTVHRLKELVVINSMIVAVAWSATIVFLPIAFADGALSPTAWVIFAYLTLGTFVCAEISNVRDVDSDRASGVSTLPVALGVRRTRHVLYGISLLDGVLVAIATLTGYLTALSAGALLLGLASLLGIVSLLGRTSLEQTLSVAAEFTRIPVLGTLLVASGLL
ncbi:MAG: UbiA family prenyltransferase [Halorhabdus sp.]